MLAFRCANSTTRVLAGGNLVRLGRSLFFGAFLVLCTSQLGANCGSGPKTPSFTVPSPATLTGPTTLTIGEPSGDYIVSFTIQPGDATLVQTATVSLIEEATGTSTGGLFSWGDVVLQPGQTSGVMTLHLACDTAGIFGADGPPFYPLCNVARDPASSCSTRRACSCRKQDTVNFNDDPNSHLGGHDAFGDHPAKVHAEIIASPGTTGPVLNFSNTLQIMCRATP